MEIDTAIIRQVGIVLCRILIDPLPRDFSAADLADVLRQFSQIVLTEIVTDPLGYSLGFGRAEMHNEEGRTMW